jgi:membrane associated rhomboid family serine protease
MTLILAFTISALTGILLVRERATRLGQAPNGLSPASITLLLVIAIPSIAQFPFPGVLYALRRDADLILHHGEFWRLSTSLVVQDGGVAGTVFNLAFLAWIAGLATVLWGDRRLLMLFASGAVVGELVGLSWQPTGAGNSVGNLGITGGILALALLSGPNLPSRLLAGTGIVLGVILVVQRNIHGPALLAGFAAGCIMLLIARRMGGETPLPVTRRAEDEGKVYRKSTFFLR